MTQIDLNYYHLIKYIDRNLISYTVVRNYDYSDLHLMMRVKFTKNKRILSCYESNDAFILPIYKHNDNYTFFIKSNINKIFIGGQFTDESFTIYDGTIIYKSLKIIGRFDIITGIRISAFIIYNSPHHKIYRIINYDTSETVKCTYKFRVAFYNMCKRINIILGNKSDTFKKRYILNPIIKNYHNISKQFIMQLYLLNSMNRFREKNYNRASSITKQSIFTLLCLNTYNYTTNMPNHPETLISELPIEIIYLIVDNLYVMTIQDYINDIVTSMNTLINYEENN